MGIDAWGWDAPLMLQAEVARERNQPGILWAAASSGRRNVATT